MARDLENESQNTENIVAETEREPYEAPAVVSEEVFETLALACGKQNGRGCRRRGGLQS
jgi:hypothetical protein